MHSYISDRTLKNKLIKLCTACCIFIHMDGYSKRLTDITTVVVSLSCEVQRWLVSYSTKKAFKINLFQNKNLLAFMKGIDSFIHY